MSKELFVEEGYNGGEYYDKDAVDALLAEKDAVIAELNAKLEGAKNETNYWCNNLKVFAQKKDAEIAELKADYERLKKQSSCTFSDDCLRVRQLKSEADKVIAEKDKEIEKLKDSIGKLLKSKTEQIMDEVLEKVIIYGEGFVPVEHAMKLVAEIRHYKYKRLLAMWLYLRECYWRCMHHNEQTRADWYNKWMDKFQKLAEHYKEAK